MTMHPQTRDLEALAAGESLSMISAHVERCEICLAHVTMLMREQHSLLERLPPERFIAAVAARRTAHQRKSSHRGVLRPGLGALAVGTIAVLVLLRDPTTPPAPTTRVSVAVAAEPHAAPQGVRLKGVGIELFRKRGTAIELLAAGDRLRAGDQLRLSLTLPEPQHVSIWFVDADGRIDAYPGGRERDLIAGPNLLPGIAVDAPCVNMTLVIATGTGRFERALACE